MCIIVQVRRFDDLPIAQVNAVGGDSGGFFGMGCHQDRCAEIYCSGVEQREYLGTAGCIQVSSGFVGDQKTRFVHKGAGHGDALHLSAR